MAKQKSETHAKAWPASAIEMRKVDELVPYARNARTHSAEQVSQIAASIREWGWTTPILVAEDSTVLAGHGRLMAARQLGLTDLGRRAIRRKVRAIAKRGRGGVECGMAGVVSQIVDCINNLDALPDMDAGCVDAIVTDPPYGLAFMGKAWDKALPDPRTWAECLRVLKPGGHAVIFGAPRLYHRLACAVEDAGFEVRDVLMWMFGSGFPKSLDVSKAIDASTPATPEAAAWSGWGTALKPAYEPILLVRKPLIGTVAQNVLTHGTGGINVDACRVERDPEDVSGWSQTGSKESENGSMSGKNYARAPKEDAAGRWPANVILDEGPEEWRRYFYCPKASRGEREAGLEAADGQRANTHPTVKPIALMEWLVRLITPPGGLVLDPFCGSGSTGVACARLGVRFLGLELDPDYAAIARQRIAHARGLL